MANNEIMGEIECPDCYQVATVLKAKRAGENLYTRGCLCGCDQRNGKGLQRRIKRLLQPIGSIDRSTLREPPPEFRDDYDENALATEQTQENRAIEPESGEPEQTEKATEQTEKQTETLTEPRPKTGRKIVAGALLVGLALMGIS